MTLSPELVNDQSIDDTPTLPATTTDPVQLQERGMRTTIAAFVIVPFLALLATVPVALAGWLSWVDVALAVFFYVIAAGGITVGYHRLFTHRSFKAVRAVRIVLGVTGSMALQGSVAQWVADHRKHHQFSDEVGDPHSPWRFGTSRMAILKGLYYAHVGWLFDEEQSPVERYAPDIQADPDLRAITRWFPAIVVATLLLPAVLGGLFTWSWQGAVTGFFWATLVRVALVHHITWSINSICHVFGKRPFKTRDQAGNVAWLAVPSLGEAWHNLHHAEPTAARHGMLRGQIDPSARFIQVMEKLRLASDVRWPDPVKLAAKLKDPALVRRLRRA